MTKAEREPAARRHYETAVALHRQGKLTEAERHYLAVRQSYPGHPGVLHGLGLIWTRMNRHVEAADVLARAHAAAPRDATIAGDLGRSHLLLGRYEEALARFGDALLLRAGDPSSLLGRGEALNILGRHSEARDTFLQLLAVHPSLAAGHFGLGTVHAHLGEHTQARAAFERAVALAPRHAAYHRALAETEPFTAHDARLAPLEALLADEGNLADDQRVELHFALAKANDDLQRHDVAFEHLRAGNAIRRSLVDYDEAAVAHYLQDISANFTAELMRSKGGVGYPSPKPIFVVGMPRSGTSLVEQILAAHPDVFGAGELLYMNEIIARAGTPYPSGIATIPAGTLRAFGERYVDRISALAPKAARVVDKLPANFRHLGLIHLAMPHARIVHVRRDPVDTCFSCYSKLFPNGLNYTYDLGELGRYYRLYEAAMAHWHAVLPSDVLLDFSYEDLVRNPEVQARRLVDFCGLAWDPKCLRFHESARPVRTLSHAQVREPLFDRSIGRGRPYARWLQPLLDAMARR